VRARLSLCTSLLDVYLADSLSFERSQAKEKKRDEEVSFAQYSVVRGLDFEESQEMGPLLEEAAKPLKEPLARWCVPFSLIGAFVCSSSSCASPR